MICTATLYRSHYALKSTIASLFEWILAVAALVAAGAYLFVALARIAYPFTLEWVEANTVLHVVRVLDNQPIYGPPSFDFIPMIYTPLYYYVAAPFAQVSGQILLGMRLVSVLASLVAFVMLYVVCRRRGIPPRRSIVAVGLFAASYPVTGYWFDIGRVDMLFLALLLVAYGLAMTETKHPRILGAGAGLALFLAYATKQSALAAGPFLVLALVLQGRWTKALWLGGVATLLWGLFVIIMNTASDGWFWLYTQRIPAAHPVSFDLAMRGFWTTHLLPNYPWLVLVVSLAAATFVISRDQRSAIDFATFMLVFAVPLGLMSVSSVAKQWGYLNGLLPLVAAIAVGGTEAYHRMLTTAATAPRRRGLLQVLAAVAAVAILAQFTALRYAPQAQIPAPAAVETGNAILALVHAAPATVFIPSSPDLLVRSGRPAHFHISSLGDVSLAASTDAGIMALTESYREQIAAQITNRSIRTAFLPDTAWYERVFSPEAGYTCQSLRTGRAPLTTITGSIIVIDRVCRLGAAAAPSP